MAWLGQPVLVDELRFKSQHGIVDQSLHARMGAEPTNGDRFGLGWYAQGEGPGVYRSVTPAWSDQSLRELAAHLQTPLFLAPASRRARRPGHACCASRSALTLAALPLLVGFLPILVDRRRRGLHDLLAGTVVVEADPARAPVARAA